MSGGNCSTATQFVSVDKSGKGTPNPLVVKAACTIRYTMNALGYVITGASGLPDQLSVCGTGSDSKGYSYIEIADAFTSSGPKSNPVKLNFYLTIVHTPSGLTIRHDPEVDNENPS